MCVHIINPGRVLLPPLRVFLVCVWFPSFFRGDGDGCLEGFEGFVERERERERERVGGCCYCIRVGGGGGGGGGVVGVGGGGGWRGGVFETWDLGG